MKHIPVIVYLSPRALKLKAESPWYSTIVELAKRDHISMFCIDEAHCVYQSGRSFRKDFTVAVDNMLVPHLAKSATFRQCNHDKVTKLPGPMEPNVSHGRGGEQCSHVRFLAIQP